MALNWVDSVQTWRAARKQFDRAIQDHLRNITACKPVPSDSTQGLYEIEAGKHVARHEMSNSTEETFPRESQSPDNRMNNPGPHQSSCLAQINKLPPELLIQIFRLCIIKPRTWWEAKFACGSCHYSISELTDLSRVCSHWRALAINQASFWSHLTFSPDRTSSAGERSWNLLQKSTERALGQPLCLTVLSDRFNPNQETQVAFQCLRPFRRNVKHLYIPSCGQYRTFIPWFLKNINAPALRSLTLTAADKISEGPFDIVDESYPALLESRYHPYLLSIRTLHLEQASFSWDNPIYHNLVYLTLESVSVGRRAHPTVYDILSILSTSPQLHTLRLATNIFPSRDTLTLPQVNLNVLKNLDLRCVGVEGLAQLLPRLHISSKRLYFGARLYIGSSYAVIVKEFLARVNITGLCFGNTIDSVDDQMLTEAQLMPVIGEFFSVVPGLRSLTLIDDSKFDLTSSLLKTLTLPSSNSEHRVCCPKLCRLYLKGGTIDRKDFESLAQTHPLLKKLQLIDSKVPPSPGFDEWLAQTFKYARVTNRNPGQVNFQRG